MASSYLDDLIWNKKGFPKKINEDEDIVLIVRQDLIVLIINAVGLYLFFLLFVVIRLLILNLNSFFWISLYDAIMYSFGSILGIVFLLIFHNYYLSLQIVTNERIIDIDQTSLFFREVSATSLGKIEDVTFKKRNLLNLLFNYGDVIVETSGRTGSEDKEMGISGFVFNDCPNPEEVSNIINLLQEQHDEKLNIPNDVRSQALKIQNNLNIRSLS